MVFCFISLNLPAFAQEAPRRYALLIGGLGGTEEYTARFQTYLADARRALVEQARFDPADVVVLAEAQGADFVTGISTAENIRTAFQRIGARAKPEDLVLVVLFGHGSYDGKESQLNIPQRDLSASDYAALADALPAERIVFVNTASASGPFAERLAGSGRIVITATRTGTQRNETIFPRFLLEALSGAGDQDKDGNMTAREMFVYAAAQTRKSYQDAGNIPTEDAVLEDDGDGKGMRLDDMEGASDGNLAAVTFLSRKESVAELPAAARAIVPERDSLERRIAELKARKSQVTEEDYYTQLENLLVQLARLNDRIEAAAQNR